MADNTLARRRVIGRITFVALSLFIIFTHLIPLETAPPSFGGSTLEPITQPRATAGTETEVLFDPVRWIMPDLLILFAFAWVTRRPSFVPALAIAGIFLLADMLYQRPPGLWTGLVLIASEIRRARARSAGGGLGHARTHTVEHTHEDDDGRSSGYSSPHVSEI